MPKCLELLIFCLIISCKQNGGKWSCDLLFLILSLWGVSQYKMNMSLFLKSQFLAILVILFTEKQQKPISAETHTKTPSTEHT